MLLAVLLHVATCRCMLPFITRRKTGARPADAWMKR
jgi:hypothetical protein